MSLELNFISGQSQVDELYQRYYTVQILAVADQKYGPMWVRNNCGFTLNTAYNMNWNGSAEVDNFSFLKSIDVETLAEDMQSFRITLSYGPWNPAVSVENPLDLPIEVEVDGENFSQLVDVTVFGNPIVNTAGDAYDPAPERDVARQIIRITMNVCSPSNVVVGYPVLNPPALMALGNKVNSGDWYGYPVQTVKSQPIKAVRLHHPAVGTTGYYWKLTYEFHYRPDSWILSVPSRGFRQLNSDGTALEPILIDGVLTQEPVFLDADGHQIIPFDSGSVVIDDFTLYEEIDFTTYFYFGTSLF